MMIKATCQPYSGMITMYNVENAKFQTINRLALHIDDAFLAEYDMDLDGVEVKSGDIVLVIPQYDDSVKHPENKYIVISNPTIVEEFKNLIKESERLRKQNEENIKN